MQMYQASMGLTAGNYLTTDRGGPYLVLAISAPYSFRVGFDTLIIYHQPVVSVSIAYLDRGDRPGHNPTLSPIGLDADGTYWSEQNDRIWVSDGDSSVQLDMFSLEPPQARAYAFQAGVDYDAADGLLWHCAQCGHDFNTPADEDRRCAPHCPQCKTNDLALQVIMMRYVPRDMVKASAYQRQLGITNDRLVKTLPPRRL